MNNASPVIRYSLIWICVALVATPPLLQAQTREETSLWESMKDSKDAEDYKGYLDKYPDGTYAPVAKRRIVQFEAHPAEQAPGATGTKNGSIPVQAPPKSGASATVTMTECEGTNNCATWTFLGKQGNGQWPSGDTANLSVEHFDADSVVIHRADSTGPSAGLTAEYRGTRKGDRIAGEFTVMRPGEANSVTGNWYATIGQAAQSLPTVMHICIACSTGMGGTATWDKDHYLILPDVPGQRTVLTVESFTPQSVVLHRINSGRYPGTAILTGQISAQGNSILNGIQTSPDGTTRSFQAAGEVRSTLCRAAEDRIHKL
jgi:hypothetical protein